ncbi:MAG: hypothetical protein ACUVRY_10025 [Thermoanaerobaculaceae bacterium]
MRLKKPAFVPSRTKAAVTPTTAMVTAAKPLSAYKLRVFLRILLLLAAALRRFPVSLPPLTTT